MDVSSTVSNSVVPNKVIGHEAQRALLKRLSANTLLFTGPAGVGRRQIARWYAAYLNCTETRSAPCGGCQSCRLMVSDRHPDLFEVSPRTQTSTGRRARRPEIRIAQLVPRDKEDVADPPLSRWLEVRPQFKKRVGIIDSADTMNVSAANSFLKMLEEPPAHAVIILIAPSAQAVLPTIASRSVPVRFGTLDLSHSDHPTARLGRLGDITKAQADSESFEEIQNLITDYANALPKGLEAAFEAADALEKAWSGATPFDLSDLLLAQFSHWPPSRYAAAATALSEFEEALEAYAAPSLAAQVLTLELREISSS